MFSTAERKRYSHGWYCNRCERGTPTVTPVSVAQKNVLIIITALCVQIFAGDTISVTTVNGTVRGIRSSGTTAFLGIPFAKPPVGELRWKIPVDPDHQESLDAFDFKPECAQMQFEGGGDESGQYAGSEDCLYLNVWTPDNTTQRFPVMVFIHGGVNQQGSAKRIADGVRVYDGQYLASHEKVVVVTIQYRLGPFGFLVHPGLAAEDERGKSGNYALLDQILALRWVTRNITNFGGDTSKVMVFGESAGALNICSLVSSPAAKGLFTRAVIQSGAPVAAPYIISERSGINYLKDTLNCEGTTDADIIQAARALPPESLFVRTKNPLAGGVANAPWKPVVDGYVLEELPLTAMNAGHFNKVPVIVGSNADEMSVAAPASVTPEMVNHLLRTFVPSDLIDDALQLYPTGDTNSEARDAYVGIVTDAQFTANTRRVAQAIASQGGTAYRYLFSHTMSGTRKLLGAFHGVELMYIFRTLPLSESYGLGGKITQADSLVMDAISGYWARFAETGSPDPQWPRYSVTDDPYFEIKPEPTANTWFRKEKCDFWDDVAGSRTPITKTHIRHTTGRQKVASTAMLFTGNSKTVSGVSFTHATVVSDLRGRALTLSRSGKNSRFPLPTGVYIVNTFRKH